MQSLVSVIILNYNGLRFVKQCLESVLNSNYPTFEVIFIDNASIDGSVELAEELFGSDRRLTVIKNVKNFGYSDGNNRGLKYAKGSYIVFLNNDTIVERNWLRKLIKGLESDSRIGAVQSKIMDAYCNEIGYGIGHSINFLGYGNPLYYRNGKGRNSVKETFFADGVALAIKRNVIDEILLDKQMLFDSDYFIYYDDTDLSWRIRLRGYKIATILTSTVRHFGTFAGKISPNTTFLIAKNRIATLSKNYGLKNMLKYSLLLLVLEMVRAVFLAKNKVRYTLAILRAILWNLMNFQKIWKKRLVVQLLIRRVSDSHVMKYMVKFEPIFLYSNFKRCYLT